MRGEIVCDRRRVHDERRGKTAALCHYTTSCSLLPYISASSTPRLFRFLLSSFLNCTASSIPQEKKGGGG